MSKYVTEITQEWTSDGQPEQTMQKLVQVVLSEGGGITQQNNLSLGAKFGSQAKMRFVGGAFCKLEWLPCKLNLEVSPKDEGCSVNVHIKENLVVGTSMGMRKKLQQRITQLVGKFQSVS